jgi:hypothetical protein
VTESIQDFVLGQYAIRRDEVFNQRGIRGTGRHRLLRTAYGSRDSAGAKKSRRRQENSS